MPDEINHEIAEFAKENLEKFDRGLYDVLIEEGAKEIHLLAAVGDVEKLKSFMESDPDCVHHETDDGRTALHLAVLKGKTGAIKALLEGRANIEKQDHYGQTALFTAAEHEEVDAAKLLLDKGADATIVNMEGATALHFAAANGGVDITRALIAGGADFRIKDSHGNTPLLLAVNFYNSGKNIDAAKLISEIIKLDSGLNAEKKALKKEMGLEHGHQEVPLLSLLEMNGDSERTKACKLNIDRLDELMGKKPSPEVHAETVEDIGRPAKRPRTESPEPDEGAAAAKRAR